MEEKVVTKEEVWAGFDRLEKMLAKNAEEGRIGIGKKNDLRRTAL